MLPSKFSAPADQDGKGESHSCDVQTFIRETCIDGTFHDESQIGSSYPGKNMGSQRVVTTGSLQFKIGTWSPSCHSHQD